MDITFRTPQEWGFDGFFCTFARGARLPVLGISASHSHLRYPRKFSTGESRKGLARTSAASSSISFPGGTFIAKHLDNDAADLTPDATFQQTSHFPIVVDESVVPQIADLDTYQQNKAAIDRAVQTPKYLHVVAWGKWLGFTPDDVRQNVELAAAENAPADAIQKINGRWLRVKDIQNESNRHAVEELARATQPLC